MRIRKTYILVCNSLKPKQKGLDCCGEKDCNALLSALKEEIENQNEGERIEVLASACLNFCANGMNVKLIPNNIFYGNVQASDVSEIINSIREGKIVERLKLNPSPRFWED